MFLDFSLYEWGACIKWTHCGHAGAVDLFCSFRFILRSQSHDLFVLIFRNIAMLIRSIGLLGKRGLMTRFPSWGEPTKIQERIVVGFWERSVIWNLRSNLQIVSAGRQCARSYSCFSAENDLRESCFFSASEVFLHSSFTTKCHQDFTTGHIWRFRQV